MANNTDKLTNFLPVNRKLFDHPLWKEARVYSKFEAWLDIIRSARFEDGNDSMFVCNQKVEWGRGEFVASLRFLGQRWGWSKSKVDNFIKRLTDESMIKKRTPAGTTQTVITICNFSTYNKVLTKNKTDQKDSVEDDKKTVEGQSKDKYNIDNNLITKEEDKKVITDSKKSVKSDKVDLGKVPDTLHSRMVHYWLKEFKEEGWTFKTMDGAKIKSLIKQLKTRLTARNIEITDDSVLESFKTLCQNLPEFYSSFDLKDIDSNFNKIISEIKNKHNGKTTIKPKQSAYDSAAAVWGS